MIQNLQELINHHPFFQILTHREVDQLVMLAIESNYQAQEVIVIEGMIVDAFYLIVSGVVEATKLDMETQEQVPVAILKKGDSIGLAKMGFFSPNGKRQATLTAIEEVCLIGWKIDIFHSFLKAHPQFNPEMVKFSEILLRMHFISQVASFQKLPAEKISSIAKQIKEITVPAGLILFHQGDIGDKCYLICSGKVEILLLHKDGSEKRVALLEAFELFGELAILTKSYRSATARILEGGNLLILEEDQLHELMQNQSTYESIMTLMIERCCPIRKTHIQTYHMQTPDCENYTILKDPLYGRYFKLSNEGWHLWQQLDGTKNLQTIMIELFKISQDFNISTIADTLFNLADAGFVFLPDIEIKNNPEVEKKLSFYEKQTMYLKKISHINLTFNTADKIFTYLYQYFKYFYTVPGQMLIFGCIFFGFISNVLYFPHAMKEMQVTDHLFMILIFVFLGNLFSIFFHELGHGLTTKYFKREVNFAGLRIIFFGLGIEIFVDTSDMWLSDRKARSIVSLSGPYVDLLTAGIASLLPWIIFQPAVALTFYLLAWSIYYGVYKNLNPILQNDGYAALKEICQDPKLIKTSYYWLNDLKNFHINGFKWQENAVPLIYWGICLFFLAIQLACAFLFQYSLRLLFPTIGGFSSAPLAWILPALAILRFLLIVRTQIKRLFTLNS